METRFFLHRVHRLISTHHSSDLILDNKLRNSHKIEINGLCMTKNVEIYCTMNDPEMYASLLLKQLK